MLPLFRRSVAADFDAAGSRYGGSRAGEIPKYVMPRSSIVIPVRNDALRLAKLLGSFAADDWRSHEVLIVDDASTDDTPDVATRFPVTLISMGQQAGPAAARNLGVEKSREDVIVFLDSDVILGPGALARLTGWFDDPDVVGVSTIASLRPANPGFIQSYCAAADRYVWDNWGRSRDESPRTETVRTPFLSTRFGGIRKHVFRDIGGFDVRFDRPCIEDAEFSLRLARKYRVVMDDAVVFTHHWPSTPGRVMRRAWYNSRLLMGAMRESGTDVGGLVPAYERVGRVSGAVGTLLLPAALFSVSAAVASGTFLGLSIALHRDLFRTFREAGGAAFTFGAGVVHLFVTISGLAGAASALVFAPQASTGRRHCEDEHA